MADKVTPAVNKEFADDAYTDRVMQAAQDRLEISAILDDKSKPRGRKEQQAIFDEFVQRRWNLTMAIFDKDGDNKLANQDWRARMDPDGDGKANLKEFLDTLPNGEFTHPITKKTSTLHQMVQDIYRLKDGEDLKNVAPWVYQGAAENQIDRSEESKARIIKAAGEYFEATEKTKAKGLNAGERKEAKDAVDKARWGVAMAVFDNNADGKLMSDEMIARLDPDKDGKITAAEFKAFNQGLPDHLFTNDKSASEKGKNDKNLSEVVSEALMMRTGPLAAAAGRIQLIYDNADRPEGQLPEATPNQPQGGGKKR